MPALHTATTTIPFTTLTLSSPTDAQMDTALELHAVLKLRRGPTSTTAWLASEPSKILLAVSCCGSNVSRSSLRACVWVG
jgi:hypothetical protein